LKEAIRNEKKVGGRGRKEAGGEGRGGEGRGREGRGRV